MAEQTRPHVRRDALAASQEAIHFGQTLMEAGAILAQDGGVRAEGSCGGGRDRRSAPAAAAPAPEPSPPPSPHLSPARAAGSAGASRSAPGCPPSPASSGGSSAGGAGEGGGPPRKAGIPGSPISPPPPTHLFPEGVQEEALQLSQTLVDARSAPLLHDGLGGLQSRQPLSSAGVSSPLPFAAHPRPRAPANPRPARFPPSGARPRSGAGLGSGWRRPALPPAARPSASPGCPQAWCAPSPPPAEGRLGARFPRPFSCGSQAQLPSACLQQPGYLRQRGCGAWESLSAFFPTLAPANEPPAPGSPPPAAAPAGCQSRVSSRPTDPAGDKGEPGHPARVCLGLRRVGGKIAAPRSPVPSDAPGGGLSGRPEARGSPSGRAGTAGNLKGKFARGTYALTKNRRASAFRKSAGALDLRAACGSDPRRQQHLHDAEDTVDMEQQPLDRREAGWPRS